MLEERKDAIRMRTERPKIAQAKGGLDASLPDVFQRRFEGEVVIVDPPEDGNPPILRKSRVGSREFRAHAFHPPCMVHGMIRLLDP